MMHLCHFKCVWGYIFEATVDPDKRGKIRHLESILLNFRAYFFFFLHVGNVPSLISEG